jgi:hypothetical protein
MDLITYSNHIIVGSGTNQPIVISANQQFSASKRFLSYAAPVIHQLNGCLSSGSLVNVINCNRHGGQSLTIGNGACAHFSLCIAVN